MNFRFITCGLILFFSYLARGQDKDFEIVDCIVASWGEEAITMYEVRQRYWAQRNPIAEMLSGVDKEDSSLRNALDDLISEKLLVAEARKLDISVSDSDISRHIKGIMEQNGWSEKDFESAVKMLGFNDISNYKEHAKREILKNRVLAVKVGGKVRVTDREVDEVFYQETEGGKTEEEVHLWHIVFLIPEEVTLQELKELFLKAERVRECAVRLISKDGDAKCDLDCPIYDDCDRFPERSFEYLACRCSQDGTRSRGGDVGFFTKGKLQQTIEDAVFALKVNQISKVVQSSVGLHILRISEKRRTPLKDSEETKARIRYSLSEKEFAKIYQKYIETLRENAGVQIKTSCLSRVEEMMKRR